METGAEQLNDESHQGTDEAPTKKTESSSTARPRVVSVRKREANRRNAQQSTGPRTLAGKMAVRFNALRHGLLAKTVVVTKGPAAEEPRVFRRLYAWLRRELHPLGALEEIVVERIAVQYWRLQRVLRTEAAQIARLTATPIGPWWLHRPEITDDDDVPPEAGLILGEDPFANSVLIGPQAKPERPADQGKGRQDEPADDNQVVDAIPDMMHVDHILRYEREITRELNRLLEEFQRLTGEEAHPLSKSFLEKVKSMLG